MEIYGRKTNLSLNMDPRNLLAEELAMDACMKDLDVRRTWNETSLVSTFNGKMFLSINTLNVLIQRNILDRALNMFYHHHLTTPNPTAQPLGRK